jgi:hypothetical protein
MLVTTYHTTRFHTPEESNLMLTMLTKKRICWRSCTVFCFLPASRWFLAWHILRPWRWRTNVPPKLHLTFNRIHYIISQKINIIRKNLFLHWEKYRLYWKSVPFNSCRRTHNRPADVNSDDAYRNRPIWFFSYTLSTLSLVIKESAKWFCRHQPISAT